MKTETFSDKLIGDAASAFIRDSGLYDAFDKHKQKDWVCKLRKTDDEYTFKRVWYYKGQEIAITTKDNFILDNEDLKKFVREKALCILQAGWRPIERKIWTTVVDFPNTLEYLKE